MTIPRNRPAGGYATSDTLSAAEFEHFDKYLSEALHGKGGVYVLATELVLGGDNVVIELGLEVGGGMTIAGDLSVGDDLEVNNNGSFGSLEVSGDVSIGDDVVIAASLQANGTLEIGGAADFLDDVVIVGNLTAQGAALFEDIVTFEQDAEFDSDVVIDGTLVVGGTATLNGAFDANGNCFLGGGSGFVEFLGLVTARERISFADDGKVAWRQQVVATDANQTLIAALVDTFFIPTGVFSAGHSVQIDDTGATDGMRVTLWSEDGTNECNVLRPGGAGIGSFGGASARLTFIERVAGTWYHRSSDGTV